MAQEVRMKQNWVKRTLIVVFWIAVWQIASMAMGSGLILASPLDTVQALCVQVAKPTFWSIVWFSFARIVGGFLASFLLALALGALAHRFTFLRDLLLPVVTVFKTVPVVCLIVLLLIWFGSKNVSGIAVFLVVFPGIYFAVLEAGDHLDPKIAQMLHVHGVSAWRRLFVSVWPQTLPFLQSTCKVVVGMSWKAGVAAELIGIPAGSIGERIYQSKLLLETADLFAWTLVIIAVSYVCEKAFLALLRNSGKWSMHAAVPKRPSAETVQRAEQDARSTRAGTVQRAAQDAESVRAGIRRRAGSSRRMNSEASPIVFHDVVKRFAVKDAETSTGSGDGGTRTDTGARKDADVERTVIDHLSATIPAGARVCLTDPSGTGKTTLLNLACGLTTPTEGSVEVPTTSSAVFQESRLIEPLSAWENVALTAGRYRDAAEIEALLASVLPVESLGQPVSELSGGMRRRVELIRALATPSQAVVLDEPFASLDAASHATACKVLAANLEGRTLLVATHDPHDVEALCATVLELPKPRS